MNVERDLFEQEMQVMYRHWWEQREREAQKIDDATKQEQRLAELNDRGHAGERIVKDLLRYSMSALFQETR